MSISGIKLPFREQARYFEKKLNLPTDTYADIYGEEHDHAFVVAGAARMDMLADFRKAVDKAIHEGASLADFRKDFDAIVEKYGWQYNGGRNWRSRIIYDTNLYSSYQAGRYEQHQEMKELRPYWQYVHKDGQKHPRKEHAAWNGLVLHCDDPWWQTHYPTNGYGCKCTVLAHSASSLKRRGLTVGKAPVIEWQEKIIGKNSKNPRMVRVPKGIDAGFDRIPGTSNDRTPSKMLLDKAVAVPPKMAANAIESVLMYQGVRRRLNAEVAAMVDRVASERIARKTNLNIGVISSEVITALEDRGLAPQTAVITLRDEDVLHAIRETKEKQLPLEFWRNIADYLTRPEAVLLDTTQKDNALLYIFDLGAEKGKVIMKMDYSAKVKNQETGKKERITMNIIRSGKPFVWSAEMRDSFEQYQRLWGEIK